MKRIIGCFLLTILPIVALADDIILVDTIGLDEILLEDIGVTLDSSDLELEQMTTPDLPTEALPDIFKSTQSDVESDIIEQPTIDTPEQTPPSIPENVIVNVIDVRETFYKLVFNPETNIYTRTQTNEDGPGVLIELVISATNNGDEVVNDVEMVNNVPAGPVTLIGDSLTTDLTTSLFRLSRNGNDFFPVEAGIDPTTVKYIQWLIFAMNPGQTFEFKYRIQIDK